MEDFFSVVAADRDTNACAAKFDFAYTVHHGS